MDFVFRNRNLSAGLSLSINRIVAQIIIKPAFFFFKILQLFFQIMFKRKRTEKAFVFPLKRNEIPTRSFTLQKRKKKELRSPRDVLENRTKPKERVYFERCWFVENTSISKIDVSIRYNLYFLFLSDFRY